MVCGIVLSHLIHHLQVRTLPLFPSRPALFTYLSAQDVLLHLETLEAVIKGIGNVGIRNVKPSNSKQGRERGEKKHRDEGHLIMLGLATKPDRRSRCRCGFSPWPAHHSPSSSKSKSTVKTHATANAIANATAESSGLAVCCLHHMLSKKQLDQFVLLGSEEQEAVVCLAQAVVLLCLELKNAHSSFHARLPRLLAASSSVSSNSSSSTTSAMSTSHHHTRDPKGKATPSQKISISVSVRCCDDDDVDGGDGDAFFRGKTTARACRSEVGDAWMTVWRAHGLMNSEGQWGWTCHTCTFFNQVESVFHLCDLSSACAVCRTARSQASEPFVPASSRPEQRVSTSTATVHTHVASPSSSSSSASCSSFYSPSSLPDPSGPTAPSAGSGSFLLRYSGCYAYTRACHVGVSVLEKIKWYPEACWLLTFLLSDIQLCYQPLSSSSSSSSSSPSSSSSSSSVSIAEASSSLPCSSSASSIISSASKLPLADLLAGRKVAATATTTSRSPRTLASRQPSSRAEVQRPRVGRGGYMPHKRGHWWNRLALNLANHMKAPKRAMRVARLGLRDPFGMMCCCY